MKHIFIFQAEELTYVQEFLKFNEIKYSSYSLWNNKNYNDVSLLPDNCLFILRISNLVDIYNNCEDSKNELLKFVKNPSNKVFLLEDYDTGYNLLIFKKTLLEIDNLIDKNQIVCLSDAITLHKYYQNITIIDKSINDFINLLPRKKFGNTVKQNCAKDFLLTIGRKDLHRTLLWQKLQDKDFLNFGFCKYHGMDYGEKNYTHWLGDKSNFNNWFDGYPSMDLYNNSWFEIVPETCYNDIHFLTEKTIKPISTKTPFLILSTPGYLKYLKSIGFKTFDGIIDESYDDITDLESRTDELVKQVEYIIKTGSEKFYNQSKDILEHNYKNYATLYGLYQDVNDSLIFQLFKEYEIL